MVNISLDIDGIVQRVLDRFRDQGQDLRVSAQECVAEQLIEAVGAEGAEKVFAILRRTDVDLVDWLKKTQID